MGWPDPFQGEDARVGRNLLIGREWRGFFWFEAAGEVPAGAEILKVEFYHSPTSVEGTTPPLSWRSRFFFGDFGHLNLPDWDAGVLAAEAIWTGGTKDRWIDLGEVGITGFDRYGSNDVAVRDASLWDASDSEWNMLFDKARLRVTYCD